MPTMHILDEGELLKRRGRIDDELKKIRKRLANRKAAMQADYERIGQLRHELVSIADKLKRQST